MHAVKRVLVNVGPAICIVLLLLVGGFPVEWQHYNDYMAAKVGSGTWISRDKAQGIEMFAFFGMLVGPFLVVLADGIAIALLIWRRRPIAEKVFSAIVIFFSVWLLRELAAMWRM